MSARDRYPHLGWYAGTRGAGRDSAELQASWALDEIDLLRDLASRLCGELARHGWGDFHYAVDSPQEPRIVALLAEAEAAGIAWEQVPSP